MSLSFKIFCRPVDRNKNPINLTSQDFSSLPFIFQSEQRTSFSTLSENRSIYPNQSDNRIYNSSQSETRSPYSSQSESRSSYSNQSDSSVYRESPYSHQPPACYTPNQSWTPARPGPHFRKKHQKDQCDANFFLLLGAKVNNKKCRGIVYTKRIGRDYR